MPSLILQTDDTLQAGVLTGRVLIGRKPFNTIAVNHPAVSRIHAWIEQRDGIWWIGDCGGRNGTYVNAERIHQRTRLRDGDEIIIAHITIRYHEHDNLPENAASLTLRQADDRLVADHTGFLFDCACGAPTWVPNFLAGREQNCGHCGQKIQIPAAPACNTPTRADRADSQPPVTCSICQCAIEPGDRRTRCPECSLEFHAECWEENLGCSAYGCSQVNALAEPEAVIRAPLPDVTPAFPAPSAAVAVEPPVPWDYALLGGGVLAAALGVLAFGVPSLAVLVAATLYLARAPRERRTITLLAILVGVAGLATGLVASYLWWLR